MFTDGKLDTPDYTSLLRTERKSLVQFTEYISRVVDTSDPWTKNEESLEITTNLSKLIPKQFCIISGVLEII